METSSLHQKAVYLEATGRDNFGKVTIANAVEIDVRWEETRSETIGNNGQPIATDANVWVDFEIPIESILWKGTLRAWNRLSAKSNLKQVVGCDLIPDIKGRNLERVAKVQKYSDSLPSLT